jgi:hypothetical protein
MILSRALRHRLAPVVGFLMIPFITPLPAVAAAANTQGPAAAPASVVVKVQPAPEVPAGATPLGALASTTSLSGAVALEPRDDSALEAFISAVTDKNSAQYHQYLAPAAFESQFGPLPSTISAVEQAVQADGLQVTGVAGDGLLVDFSGTAAQAEATFHTRDRSHRSRRPRAPPVRHRTWVAGAWTCSPGRLRGGGPFRGRGPHPLR